MRMGRLTAVRGPCDGDRVAQQLRCLGSYIPKPRLLIAVEDGVDPLRELVERWRLRLPAVVGQERRELAVIHQRRAQGRHGLGAAVSGPIEQYRLADQVSDRDIKGLG